MHRGNILLHRKLVDWEWYSDANTMRLFIHLLLTANWEQKSWRGKIVRRGQKITSLSHLAEELHLSVKQIRTSITKLKRTCEITSEGASAYTMITLTNYDSYQDPEKIRASKRADGGQAKGQTEGKQGATTKSLESLESLKKQEDNNSFDFQSTNDDFAMTDNISVVEPKSKKVKANKTPKESSPNAWAMWVDVNREFGRSDPYPAGKDLKAAKSILAEIKDPEKYADILRQFLADDDKFLMQNGHGISFLSSKINKYLNQSYQLKDTYNVGEDPDELAYILALEERIANEDKGA